MRCVCFHFINYSGCKKWFGSEWNETRDEKCMWQMWFGFHVNLLNVVYIWIGYAKMMSVNNGWKKHVWTSRAYLWSLIFHCALMTNWTDIMMTDAYLFFFPHTPYRSLPSPLLSLLQLTLSVTLNRPNTTANSAPPLQCQVTLLVYYYMQLTRSSLHSQSTILFNKTSAVTSAPNWARKPTQHNTTPHQQLTCSFSYTFCSLTFLYQS